MKASEFITKHTVAEARRSAVDQMPQGFGGGGAGGGRPAVRGGRDDGYINPPPAPGEKFAVPAATAIVGTPIAGAYLQHNSKESEPSNSKDQSSQAQTKTGSSGRGDTGMPRAKPNDGVAVATGSGVRGTTTARQEPKTADDLAHYSKGVFATRADRLNQAKVDSVLGPGYRAGTAAANRALADYFRQERAREVMAKEAERILQLSGLRDREQQELDQELAQRQSQQSLRDPDQQ